MKNDSSPITTFFIKTVVAIAILYLAAFLFNGRVDSNRAEAKAQDTINNAITNTKAKTW